MFEKAILFFERAAQIQTKEVKWQLMIASCYRRMNLFNDALKVYEEIHEEHSDNIDCLRGLVQIRKELGMPYQQYSEKLMVLDREEEAKRMMNGGGYGGQDYGGNNQGYGGGQPGQGLGYDNNAQNFQPQMPEMDNLASVKTRKMAAPAKPQEDDDEGWGGAGDLLD